MIARTITFLMLFCTAGAAFATDSDIAGMLETRGVWAALLIVYVGGFLVSLTPCVYPMIPITLGIIGARNAGKSALSGLVRSLFFVAGIVVIYAALGLIAVKTGKQISFAFQNPWVIAVIAVFFMAMGASMLDLFTIQMPAGAAGKLQNMATSRAGSLFGSFLLGCVTGVVASPCGSPVLAGVIAVAASAQTTLTGVLLLAAYALGLGTLFVFLGTFPALLSKLPKSGTWMVDIKKGLGVLLIAVGLYFLKNALPDRVFFAVCNIGLSLLVLLCAYFAVKAAGQKSSVRFWLCFVVVLTACGAWYCASLTMNRSVQARPTATTAAAALTWQTDLDAALEQAKAANKPVMIDFGAEWCAACKKLEKETFPQADVAARLADFILVRVDCTEETDENEKLQKKFGALSLPTIVFLRPDGSRYDDLNLFEFEDSAKFLQRLNKVK